MGKDVWLIGLFSILFLLSLALFLFQRAEMTGYATTGSAVSNVTISSFLSIDMSTNLQAGIVFGSVASLPADDINASHNADGAGSGSTMFVNVSLDSNSAVDFCIKANANLFSSGGDIIGIGNETYSNATTTNVTVPTHALAVNLSTGYIKAGQNVGRGNVSYYRFMLDIPAAQAAGTYNNSIGFQGVVTGAGC